MASSTEPTTETTDEPVPEGIAALEPGTILCDRHRKECFVVRSITPHGTRLDQNGETFYVPHSLFVTWLDSRVFPVEESASTALPEWLSER